MRHLLWIPLLLAGCGGPSRQHAYSIPSSQVSAANRKCGADAVRAGKTAAGQQRSFWVPCWDSTKPRARYQVHLDAAAAAKLGQAERTQCVGLMPAALEHSPFAQDEAIDEIVPHRSGATLQGAHVVLKPVPGLTVSWMRRAIACHRARWIALGKPVDYLPGDPTLVDGAEVRVTETDGRIAVLIAADSEQAGALVLDRAEDLVAPRTATLSRR